MDAAADIASIAAPKPAACYTIAVKLVVPLNDRKISYDWWCLSERVEQRPRRRETQRPRLRAGRAASDGIAGSGVQAPGLAGRGSPRSLLQEPGR